LITQFAFKVKCKNEVNLRFGLKPVFFGSGLSFGLKLQSKTEAEAKRQSNLLLLLLVLIAILISASVTNCVREEGKKFGHVHPAVSTLTFELPVPDL